MDPVVILTGIGAILTAAGGCWLVITEFRRRDRRQCREETDELNDALHATRMDFDAYRAWAFELRQSAIDAGVFVGDPPAPTHIAPKPRQKDVVTDAIITEVTT